MSLPPDQRTRDAIALLDLFIDASEGDRLHQAEHRRLREVRAVLAGQETLRSLGERARLANRRRAERADRLLRFLPRGLRQPIAGYFS